jgi:hypothetical protein
MTYGLFCCFVNNVPQPPHGEVAFEPTSPFTVQRKKEVVPNSSYYL